VLCTAAFWNKSNQETSNSSCRLTRPNAGTLSSHWTIQPCGDTYTSISRLREGGTRLIDRKLKFVFAIHYIQMRSTPVGEKRTSTDGRYILHTLLVQLSMQKESERQLRLITSIVHWNYRYAEQQNTKRGETCFCSSDGHLECTVYLQLLTNDNCYYIWYYGMIARKNRGLRHNQ
jgi:hypothetical protein